jgi:hypothetical protein
MSFHITQGLLLDRTIAISITIVVFGIIAIGGLYLLKRLSTRQPDQAAGRNDPRGAEIEAIFRRIEALARKHN